MSFWRSKVRKARKVHFCMYCGKRIEISEKYHRESGCIDGYMESYCLCNRCKLSLPYLKRTCETNDLGELYDDVIDSDMLACPQCGGVGWDRTNMLSDRSGVDCKCTECGHEYVVSLSFESIRDYFIKREEEEKAYRQHLEELRKRGTL